MPHAELSYSADLVIDAPQILSTIEQVILRHDAGSGACKGRAYPAKDFHHTHVLVSISMLEKPHRDATFTDALMAELEQAIKACLVSPCYFSMGITYSSGAYVTNWFEGAL